MDISFAVVFADEAVRTPSQNHVWHNDAMAPTDPLEEKLCVLMQRGKILQSEAIETIIYAKYHLDEAGEIKNKLDAMLHQ